MPLTTAMARFVDVADLIKSRAESTRSCTTSAKTIVWHGNC